MDWDILPGFEGHLTRQNISGMIDPVGIAQCYVKPDYFAHLQCCSKTLDTRYYAFNSFFVVGGFSIEVCFYQNPEAANSPQRLLNDIRMNKTISSSTTK